MFLRDYSVLATPYLFVLAQLPNRSVMAQILVARRASLVHLEPRLYARRAEGVGAGVCASSIQVNEAVAYQAGEFACVGLWGDAEC